MLETIKTLTVIACPQNAAQVLALPAALHACPAEILELRCDFLETISEATLTAIAECRAHISQKLLLTLRPPRQGGVYAQAEAQRYSDLQALAQLQPDYMDIEYDVPGSFLENLQALAPRTKLIRSYHNLSHTPAELLELARQLLHPAIYALKIAAVANNSVDNLRLMLLHKHQWPCALSVHAVGPLGFPSRIMGFVLGNAFTYATLDSTVLSDMAIPTIQDYTEIYHLQRLNRSTPFFALLGNPVNLSQGHRIRNQYFKAHAINAVYFKIQLNSDELPAFFSLAAQLLFKGFSVTMPLKEKVLPFMQEIEASAQSLGAINTILRKNDRWQALNTDTIGALRALQTKVANWKDQTVILFGAGGAAKAIAQVLHQQGARFWIVNRSIDAAQRIAEQYGAKALALDAFLAVEAPGNIPLPSITLVINTIPNAAWLSDYPLVPAQLLQPQQLVMDINHGGEQTIWIQAARQKGCDYITGQTMYEFQGIAQHQFWHN